MFETFYSTAAGVSFTLLGLWWVVVEFKHDDLIRDALHRRLSYNVMLYFLLPGIMSLMSLLAADTRLLWRISFAVAGLLGVIGTLFIFVSTMASANAMRIHTWGRWGAAVIYLLIILLAVFPEVVAQLGVPLQPIEVEAILISLLLFLGVHFAWALFTEPRHETRSE